MKVVSIDTNLLVLYCLGKASEKHILTNKRVQSYTIEDFRFLSEFLSNFDQIVSTPYSLAEASNLLNVSSRRTSDWFVVQTFVQIIQGIEELNVSSQHVSLRADFASFGLADSAWLEYLNDNIVFLSADEALVNSVTAIGKKAEWFRPSKQ